MFHTLKFSYGHVILFRMHFFFFVTRVVIYVLLVSFCLVPTNVFLVSCLWPELL